MSVWTDRSPHDSIVLTFRISIAPFAPIRLVPSKDIFTAFINETTVTFDPVEACQTPRPFNAAA